MIRFTGIATLLFLIVAGVPWYWHFLPQTGNEIWFGMPAWFVVSVCVSFIVSTATAIQLLVPWPEEAYRSSESNSPRTDELNTSEAGDWDSGGYESDDDKPRDSSGDSS
jgi:hypothetical protein